MSDLAPAPAAMPFASHYTEVKGSWIHYLDEGVRDGRPLLLLHGNPASSYVWRNVIPHLTPHGRVIAPDLIGMGKSGKPDIGYTFREHAAYLAGFIEALGIGADLTLVVHDWGSGLGFDWAAQHPQAVRAVVYMEAQAAPAVPAEWDAIPEDAAQAFRAFRDPASREALLRDGNAMIEQFLPRATMAPLSQEVHDAYRAPFRDPAARTPLVVWPGQVPIGDEPAYVVAAAERWNAWLAASPVPKLALYAEPGMFMSKAVAMAQADTFPNVTLRGIGPGLHFVQEDQPDAIGRAIADWLPGT
ncbi:MAG: haloalkane dehalogenase [Myxococcota bacterium]